MGKLKGYKTYILGGLAVAGAAASYLTGEATLAQAVQLAFSGLMAATLRNAIAEK